MKVTKEALKNLLNQAKTPVKDWVRHLKPTHYVILVLILGIGIFNAATALSPHFKQSKREANIERTFEQWWKDAGIEQFKSVGIEPTDEIKAQEFENYREKYLAQNPSYIPEERIEQLKEEYKKWWYEEGGSEQFFVEQGRFPDPKDFERLQTRYVDKYTNGILRYSLAFVPRKENFEGIATSWLLFPNAVNYLLFAGLFFFAFVRMEPRWKFSLFVGLLIATIAVGGILTYFLTGTSFFGEYVGERYMGMSLPLAFMLGAVAFGPKRLEISQVVKGVCVGGAILDMIINWFANPGIFGAVTVLTPVMFALGVVAGLKIETRKKTKEEISRENLEEKLRVNATRNPMAERKAKTRASIEDGFKAAKEGLMDNAQKIIQQAFNNLLQEHPVDTALVKSLTERLTSPTCYIDFMSNQWLEWGEIAKTKNAPEAAILLLKKGLSLEKNPTFARRALYILGEICVNSSIERTDGINRLKKVISMNENDMMAKQARRMLESIANKDELPKVDEQAKANEPSDNSEKD